MSVDILIDSPVSDVHDENTLLHSKESGQGCAHMLKSLGLADTIFIFLQYYYNKMCL